MTPSHPLRPCSLPPAQPGAHAQHPIRAAQRAGLRDEVGAGGEAALQGHVGKTHECSVPHVGTGGKRDAEQHVHLLLLCKGTAIPATAAGTQGGQGL